MSHARWDTKVGRDMFVQQGMSYRAIAGQMKVSHAVVALRGKNEDWPGQKAAYEASLARRSYENAAAVVAGQGKAAIEEQITVARAAVRRYAGQLADPTFKVASKDAIEFMKLIIEQLDPMKGESLKDGRTVIEGSAIHVGDADSLRRLVEMARDRVAPPAGVGGAPNLEPASARPN